MKKPLSSAIMFVLIGLSMLLLTTPKVQADVENTYLLVDGFSWTKTWFYNGSAPWLTAVDYPNASVTDVENANDTSYWYSFENVTLPQNAVLTSTSVLLYMRVTGGVPYSFRVDWLTGFAVFSFDVAESWQWYERTLFASGLNTTTNIDNARLLLGQSEFGVKALTVDCAKLKIEYETPKGGTPSLPPETPKDIPVYVPNPSYYIRLWLSRLFELLFGSREKKAVWFGVGIVFAGVLLYKFENKVKKYAPT